MTKHNEEHLFLILLNKQANPLNARLKLMPWCMLSSCFYKRIATLFQYRMSDSLLYTAFGGWGWGDKMLQTIGCLLL